MSSSRMWQLILTCLLALAPLAIAQESLNPAPDRSTHVMGPQLVAWSDLQKPEPVLQQPQPLPPPDAQQKQQSSSAANGQASKSQANGNQQSETDSTKAVSRNFTGTIAKVEGRYVIETEDTAYQIDDQEKARHYEGKRVKIAGTLDRTTGMIHVTSIELLS